MTGFLGRLAHRAVLPSARVPAAEPALEPRLPTRFEAVAREPESANENLVERTSWVTAESENARPSPENSRTPRVEARDQKREAPRVLAEREVLNEAEPPRSRADEHRTAAPDDAEIERRSNATFPEESAPMEPLMPAPASEAPPRMPPSPVADSRSGTHAPADDQRHEPPTIAQPRLELVIDRQHAERVPPEPERVAVVIEKAAENSTVPTAPPSPVPARCVATETREINFEPREPLAPLQMRPLQIDEILEEPRVAAAVSADSIVHVHIGRLEVQRPAPPPPVKTKPQRGAGMLGLDEYFVQRTESRRGRNR